ncbi:MAG: TetR/AcrR family transcriptional regulator [Nitrospirae bacterium]|nr:TetR/AcrR family transcriptional regulator [Nitrospirota bacterium]
MLDRKDQILDVAGELLQTRSFSSFSYQDLSDRIGISKASIHHHFPSKDALGKALVERYQSVYRKALEEISLKHSKPWDQLETYFAMVGKVIQSGNKICPTGALQAEHNVISADMQTEVRALCKIFHTWLSGVLTDGKKTGAMVFSGTADDQATLIYVALQGAMQNARAEGSKPFNAVVRQLKAGMKTKR